MLQLLKIKYENMLDLIEHVEKNFPNYEVIIDDRGNPGIEIDDQAAGEYR